MRALETPHYSVVASLDGLRLEDQRLPAHMKLAPWFTVDADEARVAEVCADAVSDIEPFAITGEGEGHYSSLSWRRTRMVGERTLLSELHAQLVDRIEPLGAKFAFPEHAYEGYVPHISAPNLMKEGSRRWIKRGETVQVNELWIVKSYSSNLVLDKVGLETR